MNNTIIYSFVVPIYNDGYLAENFCIAYENTFKKYLNIENINDKVELIFVNDGSPNNSLEIITPLVEKFPFVKIIDLSRNFGQHIAIACGYKEASGKYVGRLNVDMQDPPEEIPKLLKVIENEDVDLVIGIHAQERHSKWTDVITAQLFFRFFNWLTGMKTPQNTATLRVMNRLFLDTYNQLEEKSRLPQGLENWLGFKHKYVETKHQARVDNKSSYTLKKRLKLALDGAISFSDRPLKLMVYFGFIIALIGFIFVLSILVRKFILNNIIPGYTSLISVIILFSGIQILVIGVVGLYIGKIMSEVQNRPLYIIRKKINF